jgi:hypothetical protein
MKYVSLAAYKNELIIITDMDAFTTHFCYSKKQRQGSVDIIAPVAENAEDAEAPAVEFIIDEPLQVPDEDDI